MFTDLRAEGGHGGSRRDGQLFAFSIGSHRCAKLPRYPATAFASANGAMTIEERLPQ
jgi:hypothetical protein